MSVYALIPAYNVENQIGKVVEISLRYVDRVFIVNDGSTDGTGEILKSLQAHFADIDLVTNPKNLGKAESVRRGLKALLARDARSELVAQMDGDLAHSPVEIPSLTSARGHCDMVIGNRYSNRHLDHHRSAVVEFASMLIKEFTGYTLADPMCGFRLFTRKLGEIFANSLTAQGYGLETEQVLVSKLVGADIAQCSLAHIVEQDRFTKAREFTDVLQVLIDYSDRLSVSLGIKQQLASVLDSLMRRDTFACPLEDTSVVFQYLPAIDSYTLLVQERL